LLFHTKAPCDREMGNSCSFIEPTSPEITIYHRRLTFSTIIPHLSDQARLYLWVNAPAVRPHRWPNGLSRVSLGQLVLGLCGTQLNSYDTAPLRAFSTVSGRCVSTSSSAKLVVVVQVLYLWLHGFKSRRTGVSQTMIASLLAPWPPFIGTDPRKYGACAAETSVSIRSEPGKLLWLNWETSPRMSAAARRTK